MSADLNGQHALDVLLRHLKNLPPCLPESCDHYSALLSYIPDPDRVQDYGTEQGAVNRDLEVLFGNRHQGPIQFRERGAALEAVVGVLRKYIDGKSKEEVILVKWVEDLTRAAQALCEQKGWVIPEIKRLRVPTKKRAAGEEEKEVETQAKKAKADDKTRVKEATEKTAQDMNWDPDDPVDDPVEPYIRGRHTNPILDELCRPCHSLKTGKKRFRCSAPGCKMSWAVPHQANRILKHAVSECRTISAELRGRAVKESAGSSLGKQVGEMNVKKLPKTEDQPSVERVAVREGWKQTNTRFSHNILRLLCAAMLPPTVVDYDEWFALFKDINPCIKAEHRHLTITFDGGTTRRCQSFYTVHVFDPVAREAHLLEGDAASGVSHTGLHLHEVIWRVISWIGEEFFPGICSDSTGNTKKARDVTHQKAPTILPLGDACHHQSNTAKDICAHEYFAKSIGLLRQIITFFHHSSFATQHLSNQCLKMGIKQGLVAIGNTHFLTLYYASNALLNCLPAIKELIGNGVLSVKKDTGISWMKNRKELRDFEDQIGQLRAVLKPLARSCQCLESLQSHPGDVYLFWLAVMATYRDLFEKNEEDLCLPSGVVSDIRSIVNFRYSQMIEGPSQHIYLSTFFLDFHYIASPILFKRNANPLGRKGVHLRVPDASPTTANSTKPLPDQDLRDTLPAYMIVGKYLAMLLVNEVNANTAPDIFDDYLNNEEVLSDFRLQFMQYTRQKAPFNRHTPMTTPLDFWTSLLTHPDACVLAHLAIKLFSLLPNSMAEERTVSTFTKLNSPDRSHQKPATLLNMTMIRQHYRRAQGQGTSAAEKRPIVKFRDLAPYLDAQKVALPEPPTVSDIGSSAEKPIVIDPVALPQLTEVGDQPDSLQSDTDAPGVDGDSWHQVLILSRPLDTDFEVALNDGIDLGAPLLRDMLSDSPIPGAGLPDLVDISHAIMTDAGLKGSGQRKKPLDAAKVAF